MPNRVLAICVALALASACSHAQLPLSPASNDPLQTALERLAREAQPGTLGVAILDLSNGHTWQMNADRAYPMMSVFKAPVAAAVLAGVDGHRISLDQTVMLTRADIDPGSAVPSIGEKFHGDRMTFTVRQLLAAAVSESDNTAVDALVRGAGGPRAITAFLWSHDLDGMRIDMDERALARLFEHLDDPGRPPADETVAQKQQRLDTGYTAFLADPRNRTTPGTAVQFLQKLWARELLSPASTDYLLRLMYAQTVPRRLRAGLPPEVRLADKTGTSGSGGGRTAAYNDIGILTWPDGHTVLIAAFLYDTRLTSEQRDALLALLARTTVQAVHP